MRTERCSLAHPTHGACQWCGADSIRKRFCSDACRDAYRVQHVWARARVAALARAGYTCERCGALDSDTELHVHHDPPMPPGHGYGGESCAHHAENLTVVCKPCHDNCHRVLRFLDGVTGVQLALPLVA